MAYKSYKPLKMKVYRVFVHFRWRFQTKFCCMFNTKKQNEKLCNLNIPWKSKTKQRMIFRMMHVLDSLLPMGKVWYLDFLGIVLCVQMESSHQLGSRSPTT